jgi:methyltransferase (TIGR00027 family)
VFEVDFPATAARKHAILARRAAELPAVDRRCVTIDFQTERLEDKLAEAGFEAGKPTFWFWEGVSMYLRREAVKGTLRTLASLSGPGWLTMDFWHMVDSPSFTATAHKFSMNLLHFVSEPVTFGIHHEEASDFMRRHGWEMRDVATTAELHRRYGAEGRPMYPGMYVVSATTS